MFENLQTRAPDAILMLMQMYRDDARAQKIDLGVGVYKDASGNTPIMKAVKSAEKQLWETETTKTYTGLGGDPAFAEALSGLVLGEAVPREAVAAVATPGGTGAVRQGFELARMARRDTRVFVSDPTWPNHLSILDYLGMEVVRYRYFDPDSRGVDFDGMIADLRTAKAGDVVLLHGCCHNPTGANPTDLEWRAIVQVLLETGAVPMIDIAYQGFGDGLEADAAATRRLAASVPECIIAASCSKNFGIYRERTGLLMLVSEKPGARKPHQETLTFLNRQNYSFPPDHGARLVTMVLNDNALRSEWEAELEAVRGSMLSLREQLAWELRQLSGSDRFGFLAEHRGMFSRLGATPEQVKALREQHGIYMVGDSRMNIAGLNSATIPQLARAIMEVGV